VSSYVGYSAAEPQGRIRLVIGLDAGDAEMLTALLAGHECAETHAGLSGAHADRGGGLPGTPLTGAGHPAELPGSQDSYLPAGKRSAEVHPAETIAAELAGWAAGELPGQASARLAAWAAIGGVPTASSGPDETAELGTAGSASATKAAH
jgi:hypothetical protein